MTGATPPGTEVFVILALSGQANLLPQIAGVVGNAAFHQYPDQFFLNDLFLVVYQRCGSLVERTIWTLSPCGDWDIPRAVLARVGLPFQGEKARWGNGSGGVAPVYDGAGPLGRSQAFTVTLKMSKIRPGISTPLRSALGYDLVVLSGRDRGSSTSREAGCCASTRTNPESAGLPERPAIPPTSTKRPWISV